MDTVNFLHGGNLDNLTDFQHITKKKRVEYGPGLYLTSTYDVAKKYVKGNRKLYLVTVENGVEISDVWVDGEKVGAFIDVFVKSTLRKSIREQIKVVDGKINAKHFNNIIINNDVLRTSNYNDLKKFYLDNSIDYMILDNLFGWHEKTMVLYNLKKIVKIKHIKASEWTLL